MSYIDYSRLGGANYREIVANTAEKMPSPLEKATPMAEIVKENLTVTPAAAKLTPIITPSSSLYRRCISIAKPYMDRIEKAIRMPFQIIGRGLQKYLPLISKNIKKVTLEVSKEIKFFVKTYPVATGISVFVILTFYIVWAWRKKSENTCLKITNETLQKETNLLNITNETLQKETNQLKITNETLQKETNQLNITNETLQKETNQLKAQVDHFDSFLMKTNMPYSQYISGNINRLLMQTGYTEEQALKWVLEQCHVEPNTINRKQSPKTMEIAVRTGTSTPTAKKKPLVVQGGGSGGGGACKKPLTRQGEENIKGSY